MERFRYLKKEKLLSLPKAPGVYVLSSPKQILYIGKASNLRDRVKNHFQQASYRDNLFIKEVRRIGYIKTDSEIEALLMESRLIKKHLPKYNVMWRDDKKYFYVCIEKKGTSVGTLKLPRVFLTHQPPRRGTTQNNTRNHAERFPRSSALAGVQRGSAIIGPFVEGKNIKKVLKLLKRAFPYYTAKKHALLPCPYCHIALCPGPNPDEKEYRKNIRNLAAVLKGKKTSVLKTLKKAMIAAAKNQGFEKAASFRDQVFALERIFAHAKLFAPLSGSVPAWKEIEKELQKLLDDKRKIQRIEAYDISNIQGKEATGSQVTFLKGVPAKEYYRKYKIKISGKSNDFAMMEELVSRRLSHPEWPYPDLMVIDGGKGQLSSAFKAISNLARLSCPQLGRAKLHRIKVAALAKKQNELFFPGKPKSVVLGDLPRPLENLFLRIRDEAHRFALSYHRTLRKKELLGAY